MSFPNIVHADDQQIYANDSARGLPVGQRVELPNGRTFRYALAGGTALIAGNLQAASAQVGGGNNDNAAITTNVAIGDTTVAITNGATTWTLDELKGGFIVNERSAELGAHYWQIYGNTAEAAGSAAMTLTLVPGVAFDTVLTAGTSVLTFGPSPWSKVIVNPSSISGIPAGVAMVVVTAANYGYLQTHGLGACKLDAQDTNTVGLALVQGDNTAGSLVGQDANVNLAPIARVAQASSMTDEDFTAVFLLID